MATSYQILNHVQTKGRLPRIPKRENSSLSEKLKCFTKNPRWWHRVSQCGTSILVGTASLNLGVVAPSDATISGDISDVFKVVGNIKLNIPGELEANSDFIQRMFIADLDPATAKLAIDILGPFLSAFSFLFIARIIMSWYPKLPVGKLPYVIAYAPTEPLLVPTRKLIPPVGGVDVSPVVWFALLSFLNEILLGSQGLLVLLSQQVS